MPRHTIAATIQMMTPLRSVRIEARSSFDPRRDGRSPIRERVSAIASGRLRRIFEPALRTPHRTILPQNCQKSSGLPPCWSKARGNRGSLGGMQAGTDVRMLIDIRAVDLIDKEAFAPSQPICKLFEASTDKVSTYESFAIHGRILDRWRLRGREKRPQAVASPVHRRDRAQRRVRGRPCGFSHV
jgi:hypothetical protein